jgi:hypothetical protein
LADFQAKYSKELFKPLKFSKEVLELRHKEAKLIALKKYQAAEDAHSKVDLLEAKERAAIERSLRKQIIKKEKKLRESHEKAMIALLKRIQRDKNEQLRQRQEDSIKLIRRNRNLVTNLLYKQNLETKKVIDQVEQTLRMTKTNRMFKPDMSRYNTALPCKRKKIK